MSGGWSTRSDGSLRWPGKDEPMTSSGSQRWDPAQYGRNARFVSDLGAPVLELLAPQPGERILDLGCGDGALTVELLARGCSVVGVDASVEMVNSARRLGVDARTMDGRSLDFSGEFAAVFSNAALHWMRPPEPVIDGVWRALSPGGRFVGELGGHGNVASIIAALDAALARRGLRIEPPWYFPAPDEYRALLAARGFEVHTMNLFPRPTRLPGDVGAWLETFAQPWTDVLDEAERRNLIAEVTEALRAVLCDGAGHWDADYVRLRFAARKPASRGP